MDSNTNKRDSQDSRSTDTFSVPDSNVIPANLAAPSHAHQTDASTKLKIDGSQMQDSPDIKASAAENTGSTGGRWSEGTFGQASTKGPSSGSYSGISEEATTAQAGTAQVVDVKKTTADEDRGIKVREGATSGDAVALLEEVDEELLTIISSTGQSSQDVRKRRRRQGSK